MVFKRPAGSRDDKPGKSSSRSSRSDDRPKKSASTPKGKATPNGEKKILSRPEKTFQSNRFSDDKPKSNFRGGESSGDKRSGAKPRPYSGRPASDSDERPKRNFGGDSTGERKSFSGGPRKPYSGRPTTGDNERPKRSFGGESQGEKKPYSSPRTRSSASFEGKPKRSFGGDAGGERKFAPRGTEGGIKKREGGFKEKSPFGERPAHRPHDRENQQDAPKIMRGRKNSPAKKSEDDGLIRLNRYISNAGICSRRKADELITAGVVSVNGEVVTELGTKVDPFKDTIKYNGETLKREKMVYVLLNKPKDYITTTDDPQERRTVMHLVEKASRERIYPVGRLDRNTTGLLLMTNDGDLADKLSHPRNSITKLYQVELSKSLTQGDLNKLTFGLELEDGVIKPDSVSYVTGGSKREIGIQIHSGKNRIVRRMFEHLGYEVVKLDRVVYANLTKKDLPRGRWRYLDEKEVIQLKHLMK
ncbi:pseudouridine synthase [Mucilaginibacter gossypii]|uniref:pseudouridine synthase n=1 Tax=Mucilaginibacter gossypii TaxID=551996 RepID=UPI000DCC59F0|nr:MULTISPECIES: pseudouridine synthase [Mucilaginibacter]QTE35520.1 pseudouridine synthase [Mucilaginibacter gossypii]RAV59289.1 pseudouridylate synthase [Mucilaginibacter rubeus]